MTEKKAGIKTIFPTATLLFGGIFTVTGLVKYGFWDTTEGPEPGFFPIIIGIALCITSVFAIVQSFSENATPANTHDWFPALAVLAVVAGTLVIGMYTSLAIFLVGWLRFYEKCTWKTTLIVLAVMAVIVIGAFGFWLEVPFPKGILFSRIF